MKTGKKFSKLVGVAGLWLLAAAGCGTPGSLDLCHSNCNYSNRCLVANDVLTQNCHNACNSEKMRSDAAKDDANWMSTCQNYADIRNKQLSCYSRECSEIAGCLVAAAPPLNCVFK